MARQPPARAGPGAGGAGGPDRPAAAAGAPRRSAGDLQPRAKFDPTGYAEARRQKLERAEKLRAEQRARLQAMGQLPHGHDGPRDAGAPAVPAADAGASGGGGPRPSSGSRPASGGRRAPEWQTPAAAGARLSTPPWAVGGQPAPPKPLPSRAPLQSPWAQEADLPARRRASPKAAPGRGSLSSPWAQEGDPPAAARASPQRAGPVYSPPWALQVDDAPAQLGSPPARAGGPLWPPGEDGAPARACPPPPRTPEGAPPGAAAASPWQHPELSDDQTLPAPPPRRSPALQGRAESPAAAPPPRREGEAEEEPWQPAPGRWQPSGAEEGALPSLPAGGLAAHEAPREAPPTPEAPPLGGLGPPPQRPPPQKPAARSPTAAAGHELPAAGFLEAAGSGEACEGAAAGAPIGAEPPRASPSCEEDTLVPSDCEVTLRPSRAPSHGRPPLLARAADAAAAVPQGGARAERARTPSTGDLTSAFDLAFNNPAGDTGLSGHAGSAGDRTLLPPGGAPPAGASPPGSLPPSQQGTLDPRAGRAPLAAVAEAAAAEDLAADDPDVFGPPEGPPRASVKHKRRRRPDDAQGDPAAPPPAAAAAGVEPLKGLLVDKTAPRPAALGAPREDSLVSSAGTLPEPDAAEDGADAGAEGAFRVEIPAELGAVDNNTRRGMGTNVLGGLFGGVADGPSWLRQLRPESREPAAEPPPEDEESERSQASCCRRGARAFLGRESKAESADASAWFPDEEQPRLRPQPSVGGDAFAADGDDERKISIEDYLATAKEAARALDLHEDAGFSRAARALGLHAEEAARPEAPSVAAESSSSWPSPAQGAQRGGAGQPESPGPVILRSDLLDDVVSDDPMVFGKPRPAPQPGARRQKQRPRPPPQPVPQEQAADVDTSVGEDSEEAAGLACHAASEGSGAKKFHIVEERPRSQPLQQRKHPPRCPESPLEALATSASCSSSGGLGKLRSRQDRSSSRGRHRSGSGAPERRGSQALSSEASERPLLRRIKPGEEAEEVPLRLPPLEHGGAARGRRCTSQPPAAQPRGHKGKARPKSQGPADPEEKCERRMFDKNTLRQMNRDMFVAAIQHYRQIHCKPTSRERARGEPAEISSCSEGISVFLRKRPIFGKEEQSDFDVISVRPGQGQSAAARVVLHNCLFQADLKTAFVNHLTFQFDHVFDERVENSEVYRVAASRLIQNSLDGGIGTMFMFGQTGSGKTHTMSAIQEFASRDLFEGTDGQACMSCQYVELRGNRCFDLLAPPATGAGDGGRRGGEPRPELRLREQADGSYAAEGALDLFPKTPEELCGIMEMAQSRRATSATDANAVSSRSHAVCTLRLFESEGQLLLVDCAGTERRKDSMYHSKERQQEGAEINASLHALKECIRSFASHQRVPSHMYRASSLTKILADAFIRGARARLAVICTASPCATDTEHTIATLRMGMALGSGGSEHEEKQMMADCMEKKQRVVHPKQWTPEQVFEWLAAVSDGQFQDLVDVLPSNTTGQMLTRMTENRCAQLCGGSVKRGRRLFDALHAEMQAADAARKG